MRFDPNTVPVMERFDFPPLHPFDLLADLLDRPVSGGLDFETP
jgi:hypothetical protein